MLKLKNINKVYKSGNITTHALKDINLEFRKSEFVSILGPSGCGKTTMLNIIGGLDQYTDGDLVINNKSTKFYKDKDWDTYRNHSIGFVFQSYNLIPHQTVLENVELALTLSGVSKKERKKRAINVLTKVGLKDKINNKPSQLSGGQMQRVAIARALVNDPEIILADEPTGALDTKSSVQIMELLKKISDDKLIIMVTHNPELAEKYSTRIVTLLDGKLTSDSNPYKQTENDSEEVLLSVTDDSNLSKRELKKKNTKKRMSFFTAMALSFKNLLTKKARTALVTFAGSIGIIGIALILAISSGFSSYVNKIQQNTLSTYPITISAKSIDFTEVMASMMIKTESEVDASHDKDKVYPKDRISSILESIGTGAKPNNLNKFYDYIEDNRDELNKYVSAIKYNYDLGLEFFKDGTFSETSAVQPKSSSLYKMIMMFSIIYFENIAGVTVEPVSSGGVTQYKINFTQNTNRQAVNGYFGAGTYESNEANGYIDPLVTEDKIIQIINGMLGGMVELDDYKTSSVNVFYEMIDSQNLIDNSTEFIYGRRIQNDNEAYLVLDRNNEVDDYLLYSLGFLDDTQMQNIIRSKVTKTVHTENVSYNDIINNGTFKVISTADCYTEDGEGHYKLDYSTETNPITTTYINAVNNTTNKINIVGIIRQKGEDSWVKPGVAYTKSFTQQMMTDYNTKVNFYNNNGGIKKPVGEGQINIPLASENHPSEILIYVNTFEAKDKVKNFVQQYNNQAEQGDEISYQDLVGTIMNTVSIIITSITYVLIAFVGVSLIVSSIMIAVITHISVIERTKEIGILRSVGASKRDVSRVFTAESFIIGLLSGAVGIGISVALIIPINIILEKFTEIAHIAVLPLSASFILIGISIVLTLIAGLIPSKMAAKKDPVVALREN